MTRWVRGVVGATVALIAAQASADTTATRPFPFPAARVETALRRVLDRSMLKVTDHAAPPLAWVQHPGFPFLRTVFFVDRRDVDVTYVVEAVAPRETRLTLRVSPRDPFGSVARDLAQVDERLADAVLDEVQFALGRTILDTFRRALWFGPASHRSPPPP